MNDLFKIIADTIVYVTGAPYFWVTMGSVSMTSIFVGAIIYDGVLPIAIKGTVSIGIYSTFIIMAHMIRVADIMDRKSATVTAMTYASIVAISIITLFWLLGIIIGVYTSMRVKGRHQLDRKKK